MWAKTIVTINFEHPVYTSIPERYIVIFFVFRAIAAFYEDLAGRANSSDLTAQLDCYGMCE